MTNKRPLQLVVVSVLAIASIVIVIHLATPTTSIFDEPVGVLKPIAQWTDDLVLSNSEVPSGWQLGGGSDDGKFGAGTRRYWFDYAPERGTPFLAIGQIFGIYPTELKATEVYRQWLKTYFPTQDWHDASDLDFGHYASQSRVACYLTSLNSVPIRMCSGIARYENLVVMVSGNVRDANWLTAQDFSNTLKAADRRIAVVMSGNTP